MARKINVGNTELKREDTFHLDPREIVVEHGDNARWNPTGVKDFDSLHHFNILHKAIDFVTPGKGQVTPCIVRPGANGRVKLTAGFHRHAAALLVQKGFTYTNQQGEEVNVKPNPDFKLHVALRIENDDEAYETAITENASHVMPSPMDQAIQMRTLLQKGRTKDQVKEVLGNVKDSWLNTLEKLLVLPDPIKLLFHKRILPTDVAKEMADMSADEREDYLRQTLKTAPTTKPADASQVDFANTGGDGHLAKAMKTTLSSKQAETRDKKTKLYDSRKGRELLRARKQAKGGNLGLTMAETRRLFHEISDNAEVSPNIRFVADVVIATINGKKGTQAVINALEKVVKGRTIENAN